jgi:hypothetical protein
MGYSQVPVVGPSCTIAEAVEELVRNPWLVSSHRCIRGTHSSIWASIILSFWLLISPINQLLAARMASELVGIFLEFWDACSPIDRYDGGDVFGEIIIIITRV